MPAHNAGKTPLQDDRKIHTQRTSPDGHRDWCGGSPPPLPIETVRPRRIKSKSFTYAFILGFARLGLIYRYRLLRRGFPVTG